MGVSEAFPRPHHHVLTPSSFLASERFLSPCFYQHMPPGNVVRVMPCSRNYASAVSPVMSVRKGHSTTISEELCDVVWTLEANLAAGELLYVSGDLTVLGCWKPEMAILMTPSERTNLWKAEVKVPSGANIKYNYFIREESRPYRDIIWRPGPEFSLSVPLTTRDRKVTVRDLWMNFDSGRYPAPAYAWGSWIQERYLSFPPLTASLDPDKNSTAKHLHKEPSNVFLNGVNVKDKLHVNDDDATISYRHESVSLGFSDRDQPIEEPWLLQSLKIFLVSKNELAADLSEGNQDVEYDVTKLGGNDQNFQVKDKILLTDESKLILKDDPLSTVLLINSSICTMQRIAVMEDGKLVELLLEPVKSNVQCDSLYLGVVTKRVPHMGGAFVNIGGSRASFMDIKQSREPFMFPPFRQRTKKQDTDGSVLEAPEETAQENEHTSHDVEVNEDNEEFVTHDDLRPFMHDENDENDDDEDFDIPEVKDNVNGSIVDYGHMEHSFEHLVNGRAHHMEDGKTTSSLLIETGASTGHQEDGGDTEHALAKGNKWGVVRKGTKIIVQVVKEGLGTKGPTLTAYPKLKSRFWILLTRCDRIGVSKKISGVERTRLKLIAKTLQPPGFGLTVRTVASGHSIEDLQKDLEGLLSTWKTVMEHAKAAALAADEGVEGAVPVILHRAMGQTLSVVQDYFSDTVTKMVVDSPRTYHEVTNYLQDIAPDLCDRVELYNKRIPLFDEFNIEEEINNMLSKRVPLAKGGSLIIEQTEALVSIDVNGGHVMFRQGTSQEKAILEVNLAAAKQIAREIRLRDIGGIIVVDFIDMADESNKRLVYEEMKKAVERDRSTVKVSELSKHGLMEMTRKRVRPSVTFMISEPCPCCHATGRVEALETSFSKIEQEICRLLATMDQKADPENPKSWPRFVLRVDNQMCSYLTSGKKTKLAILSSSLKVWLLLKVARGFTRGAFEVKPFTDDKMDKNQHQVAIPVLRHAGNRTINSGKKVTLVPIKKKTSGK